MVTVTVEASRYTSHTFGGALCVHGLWRFFYELCGITIACRLYDMIKMEKVECRKTGLRSM